jgi:hypothetical protein
VVLALLGSPVFAGQDVAARAGRRDPPPAGPSASASDAVQSFRDDFDRIGAHYASFFERIGDERGRQSALEAREGFRALTDEQIAAAFGGRLPDLGPAVQATERLGQWPMPIGPSVPAGRTPGFPDKPPIIGFCDAIPHDPVWRSAALGAFHLVRAALAYAKFGCLQSVAGTNASAACIPLAIARDVAEAAFDLMSFCSGEEDSALALANYERLAHIHADIEAALSAVLARIDTKAAEIMAEDDADRRMLTREFRNVSCDLMRLLHTPEGHRESANPSCVGQPKFPYDFPEH